jgi:hypothetical protein
MVWRQFALAAVTRSTLPRRGHSFFPVPQSLLIKQHIRVVVRFNFLTKFRIIDMDVSNPLRVGIFILILQLNSYFFSRNLLFFRFVVIVFPDII